MPACTGGLGGLAAETLPRNALSILYLCLFPTEACLVVAQVGWEESSREVSQRLGGDKKQEAMLARWLQEGNRRLR